MRKLQGLRSAFFAAIVTAMALGLLATGPGVTQPKSQPESASAVLGEPLYQEHCGSCHGAQLEGQANWRSPNADGTLPAPPHDETGHSWHHGDALLFEYTKLGGRLALEASGVTGFKSGMPGFADALSDDEIWHILAFIKSKWSDRIRELQSTRTKAEQLRAN